MAKKAERKTHKSNIPKESPSQIRCYYCEQEVPESLYQDVETQKTFTCPNPDCNAQFVAIKTRVGITFRKSLVTQNRLYLR
jgi:aspartate carbamoyltransferase regulatory subunit